MQRAPPVETLKLVICLLTLLALPFVLDASITIDSSFTLLAANLLPVVALWGFLIAISGRIWLSTGATGLVVYLLFEISALKEANLEQPLVFPDVYLVGQVFSGWELLGKYAAFSPALLLIPIAILGAIILLRRERTITSRLRLITLLFALVTCGVLTSSDKALDTLYSAYAHGSEPWAGADQIREAQGLLASLATGARLALSPIPDFDKRIANQTLAKVQLAPAEAVVPEEHPDIILWLAESFFDPSALTGVEKCNVLPKLCNLEHQAQRFDLKVPTYGGNTTRTSFEVLTGVPYKLLPSGSYAFQTVVKSVFPSLVWELRTRGYSTHAIHPHLRTFWGRDRAFPLLGFQTFTGEHKLGEVRRDGLWISDETLKDKVIDEMGKSVADPKLVFAISMEGHGPYRDYPVADEQAYNAIKAPRELSPDALAQWRSYIYHASNALTSLEYMLAFIADRHRPTLLVFFGDHLPGLDALFEEWSFANGENHLAQTTPALVFANYDLELPTWQPSASHELGLWIHEATQLHGNSRFAQLAAVTALRKSDESAVAQYELENLQVRLLH